MIDSLVPECRVMISSPVGELKVHRRKLKDELEKLAPTIQVIISEDWGASAVSPEQACLDVARDCHLFILLMGRTYGSSPRPGRRSVTHREYDAARSADPSKIRAYLLRTRSREPKQRRFVDVVRNFSKGHVSPELARAALAKQVTADVFNFMWSRARGLGIGPNVTLSTAVDATPPDPSGSFGRSRNPANKLPSEQTLHELQKRFVTQRISASRKRLAATVLSSVSEPDLHALGILASGYLLDIRYIRRLFPQFKWRSLLRRLASRGVVSQGSDGELKLEEQLKSELSRAADVMRTARRDWIETLEQHREHWDLAYPLIIHLAQARRFDEAVDVAHSIIAGTDSPDTAAAFDRLIAHLDRKAARVLSPRAQGFLLDCHGTARVKGGRYSDASVFFQRMLVHGRRTGDADVIGQALLHKGLAQSWGGDNRAASRTYREAAEHARRSEDRLLLGRSLNNLSHCLLGIDVHAAEEALKESIQVKKSIRDREGLFAGYAGMGILAGLAGRDVVALRWFERSRRLVSGDLQLAHALHNLAVTNSKLGNERVAVDLSQRAHRLAVSVGRLEVEALTLRGLAAHAYKAGDARRAHNACAMLSEVELNRGNVSEAASLRADAAVIALRSRRFEGVIEIGGQALKLVGWGGGEAVFQRAIAAIARAIAESRGPDIALRRIRKEQQRARRSGNEERYLDLYALRIDLLIDYKFDDRLVLENLGSAIDAAGAAGSVFRELSFRRTRFFFLEKEGAYEKAMADVDAIAALTSRRRALQRDYAEALNEKGRCLEKLGDKPGAHRCFQRAYFLAKRTLDSVPGSLLNNYAENLRRSGRPRDAIPFYEEALFRHTEDDQLDDRLLTEHNLALALFDSGDQVASGRLLRRIQSQALRGNVPRECIRALIARGNHAWLQDRRTLARRLYGKARELARREKEKPLYLAALQEESKLLIETRNLGALPQLLRPYRRTIGQVFDEPAGILLAWGKAELALGRARKAIQLLGEAEKLVQDARVRKELEAAGIVARALRGHRRQRQRGVTEEVKESWSQRRRFAFLRESMLMSAADPRLGRRESKRQVLVALAAVQDLESISPLDSAELYWQLGWVMWEKDPAGACQALVCAMITSMQDSSDHVAAVGVDLGVLLVREGLANGTREVGRLTERTVRWLRMQPNAAVLLDSPAVVSLLLLPFRIADGQLRMKFRGRRATAEQRDRVVHAALESPNLFANATALATTS